MILGSKWSWNTFPGNPVGLNHWRTSTGSIIKTLIDGSGFMNFTELKAYVKLQEHIVVNSKCMS